MNLLITGGFDSMGVVVVDECLRRGHTASVLERRSGRTERLARRYGKRNVKVLFGDLRKAEDVSRAMMDQDVVIHLAAILPPASETHPDYLDWYDTEETRPILQYQRHSLEEWQMVILNKIGYLRPLIPLFAGVIMRWIERQSPRYSASI